MRYRIVWQVTLATALVSCHDGKKSVTSSAIAPPSGHSLTELGKPGKMPAAFWNEFQSALRARNAEKIAGMTRFPMIGMLDGFGGINQRESFIRHFDGLFPEEAATALLGTSASNLESERFHEAGVAGECWRVSYTYENPVASEFEWTRWYVFSRQPDGSIKLTEIDIAG
ncbi:hypothetical protein [Luteolibacter soli]|uniref:Lipoprotein n=1 Tax=Luteolibacter soli TaxID=3135280 RepID=A0ABU9AWY9_9BACT